MNPKLGIMQGRLLPKYKGRYQAHPVGNWPLEFELASSRGLDCIEFILDFDCVEENPLSFDSGIKEISSISKNSGVAVRSICADYFMISPLHSNIDQVCEENIQRLVRLLGRAETLGVSDIVIPCVDGSGLRGNPNGTARFVEAIKEVCRLDERRAVNIALETDLSPGSFAALLTELDRPNVTVNYDIGNSAALGYDVEEEFFAYGEKITDVHIKDRKLGGASVFLGRGNADLADVFRRLEAMSYSGLLIMQAFRDDQGLTVFDEQFELVKRKLEQTSARTLL